MYEELFTRHIFARRRLFTREFRCVPNSGTLDSYLDDTASFSYSDFAIFNYVISIASFH